MYNHEHRGRLGTLAAVVATGAFWRAWNAAAPAAAPQAETPLRSPAQVAWTATPEAVDQACGSRAFKPFSGLSLNQAGRCAAVDLSALQAAAAEAPPAPSQLQVFLQTLLSFRGVPYKWGGSSPAQDGGLDCSGLVVAGLRRIGVTPAARSAAQLQEAAAAQPLEDPKQLKPGDLIFEGDPASHVLVYLGEDRVIEAPHPGAVVRVQPMRRRLHSEPMLSFGSLLPDL